MFALLDIKALLASKFVLQPKEKIQKHLINSFMDIDRDLVYTVFNNHFTLHNELGPHIREICSL